MRRARLVLLAFLLCSLLSCEKAQPDVGFRVDWLEGPGLPASVSQIDVRVWSPGSQEALRSSHSVASLTEGRLVLTRFEPGQWYEIELLGVDSGNTVTHIGRSGPLRFSAGQRRVVRVAMYRHPNQNDLDRGSVTPGGTFLHTATRLVDGRVLIAGGFDRLSGVACPVGVAGEGIQCFEARATTRTLIFDPPTALFWEVEPGLPSPRAGHAAQLLNDGRVVLSGGVEHAILAMHLATSPAGATDYRFIPQGDDTARRELLFFNPDDGAEAEDLGRDGDPGRGRFGVPVGIGGPGRFLHAAALAGEDLVLVGGAASADTYDVVRTSGPVQVGAILPGSRTRSAPAALTLGNEAWFWGADAPTSNSDLLARFNSDWLAPLAPFAAAPAAPGLALLRPTFQPIRTQNGLAAFVSGWWGPRCAAGQTAPMFGAETVCGVGSDPRSAIVHADGTSVLFSTPIRAALAGSDVLGDGSVIVTGGISTYDGRPILGSMVIRHSGATPQALAGVGMRNARMLHSVTGVFDAAALVYGGVTLNARGELETVPQAELLSLAYQERRQWHPSFISPAGNGDDGAVTADAEVDAAVLDSEIPDSAQP